MTFDPPNEDAEVFDIPAPAGTLLDLTPVHFLSSATLGACEAARPDLDWDVRRFRPNLVLDLQPTEPSICSSIRRDHSTAYSIGSVLVIGSMKPLTTMPMACSSERPRLIR
jgi:uncharacterized protein YcbX